MSFEGSEGKIDDLRHWVNFGVNVAQNSSDIYMVVWNADRLSPECQTILLKPLEETSEKTKLLLMVANENGLLPTIISRCQIQAVAGEEKEGSRYWKEVMNCFTKGPATGLTLADKLEKEEMELALAEVIEKLKKGLESGVSKNRLKVLKMAIDCLAKLKYTNVNAKLAFGNFLIRSWELIKA